MSLCLVTIIFNSAFFIQRFQVQLKLPSDRMTVSKIYRLVSFVFTLYLFRKTWIKYKLMLTHFQIQSWFPSQFKTISLSLINYVLCLEVLGRISKEQLYLIFWNELEVLNGVSKYTKRSLYASIINRSYITDSTIQIDYNCDDFTLYNLVQLLN